MIMKYTNSILLNNFSHKIQDNWNYLIKILLRFLQNNLLLLNILLTLLLIYSQDIFKGSIAEIKVNTKMLVKACLFNFH